MRAAAIARAAGTMTIPQRRRRSSCATPLASLWVAARFTLNSVATPSCNRCAERTPLPFGGRSWLRNPWRLVLVHFEGPTHGIWKTQSGHAAALGLGAGASLLARL